MIVVLKVGKVKLRSKVFHGTSLIFHIDWHCLIANIEMNRKIAKGPEMISLINGIPFLPGPLERSSTVGKKPHF